MRFLQAYANSAVCSATRTALITGRYQYRLRLGLEEPLAGNADVGLPPEHPTLPSLLKKAGYGSTLVGKWHLGVLPKFGPLKSGYDHFYGFRGGAVDYFSHAAAGAKEDLWDDDVLIHQVGLPDRFARQSCGGRGERLRKIRPALPGKPSLQRAALAVGGSRRRGGVGALAATGKRRSIDFDGGSQKTYQKMIEEMDRQIGRVLQALDANGLTENTIIIFTSDNGGERFADTWPFTGKKTELLEGGLRIPSGDLLACPHSARAEQPSRSRSAWTGCPRCLRPRAPRPIRPIPPDGMNLLPMLTQNAAPVPRKLFWRYKANAQRAHRDGDYKYLKILDNTFLFNVVEDPMERANLKERQKDVYARLVREWHEWNATMLPEIKESFTHSFDGKELADHYGAKNPD